MTAQNTTGTNAEEQPPTDELTEDELEKHWLVVLGEIWRQADWSRFENRAESWVSIFGSALYSAKKQPTVNDVIDRLAGKLGTGSPNLPTANLGPLRENEQQALEYLREERVWLANQAKALVATAREHEEAVDDVSEPEPTTSTLSDFVSNGEKDTKSTEDDT